MLRKVKRLLRPIAICLNNVATILRLHAEVFSDAYHYFKHSLTFGSKSIDCKRARLLLYSHSLEKGLSMPNPRKGFGCEKARYLFDYLKTYLDCHEHDFFSAVAVSVLMEYFRSPHAASLPEIENSLKEIRRNVDRSEDVEYTCGTKYFSPSKLKHSYEDIFSFVESRCSVREFSEEVVTFDQIQAAVRLAQTVPSACNRQTSRVHVFEMKDSEWIIENQLGDQGWTKNADKLFVITSSLSFFGGVYERHQAYIDGGMFSMQLVLGLQALKIASCCKMYIRTFRVDREFRRLTHIPKNEVPIMLIAAGHFKKDDILVPCSKRLPVSEVLFSH